MSDARLETEVIIEELGDLVRDEVAARGIDATSFEIVRSKTNDETGTLIVEVRGPKIPSQLGGCCDE